MLLVNDIHHLVKNKDVHVFTGTTTVGNVCRLVFQHPTSFAAILGIPVEIGKIIHR